ncbi:MAG: hypothetical protein ACYSR0_00815 [Planctomycetota bacterium]|jgi:hypothetical protein
MKATALGMMRAWHSGKVIKTVADGHPVPLVEPELEAFLLEAGLGAYIKDTFDPQQRFIMIEGDMEKVAGKILGQ